MKDIFGKTVLAGFIFSTSVGMAQNQSNTVPVLSGEPALVTKVEISAAVGKPPYRSALVATVTYNAVCDTPLSFVAVKTSNLDFEIYETRDQGPPPPIPCQAQYLVTKKITLTHYLDIHPNAVLIKVNGVSVSN